MNEPKLDNKYEYTYSAPFFRWNHRCHWCKKRLSKVPKDKIVEGERVWGLPYSIDTHWWCNEECAMAELRSHEAFLLAEKELNKRLKKQHNKKVKNE